MRSTSTRRRNWLISRRSSRCAAPGRVTLLLGNHDFHYLSYVVERYSGYSFATQRALGRRVDEWVAEGILEAAAYLDGRLYTHAGVTRTWAVDWNVAVAPTDLPQALAELLHYRPRAFGFHTDVGAASQDPSGDDVWQGPLWVRPRSLRADAYCGGQVFGHTVVGAAGIEVGEVGFSVDGLSRGEWVVVREGVAEVRRDKGR